MIEKIIEKLTNKNIAILGFGKEGKSSYEFLRKYLKDIPITILDANESLNENQFLKEDKNIIMKTGKDYLKNLEEYDYILKSPGITLKDLDISKIEPKITSQIELLLEFSHQNTIGITGTKGKSTTTSLVYEILKEQGKNVVLVGNIGIPVFSVLENTKEDTIFVMEISSHQLEFLHYSPHIGVILNLFEDHLDHAKNVEHYHNIKLKMFQNQTREDIMIYCQDNDTLKKLIEERNYLSKSYTVSLNAEENANLYTKEEWIYYNEKSLCSKKIPRKLLGSHNLENIMVALLISELLSLNIKKTLKTISNFKPLAYRLEWIGKINDIDYYMDTLATIPKATIKAIETLKKVNTLIFGGLDRGISYEEFKEYLKKSNIDHFICMPTTGYEIGKFLPKEKTYFIETLKEAVSLAKKITAKNTICLLSPAASSYEQFKNYQEKGDKFKEYVLDQNIK